MTNINIKFVIAVLSIVFASLIIGLWVTSINKSSQMVDQLQDLNNKIQTLDNRIDRIQDDLNSLKYQNNDLNNQIKNYLDEKNKNYYDEDYKLIDFIDSQTAIVEIYFSLKETSLSGETEIVFGSGNQYNQESATRLADGKYMAQIQLDIDRDYQISYSIVLQDLKTEKLMDINIGKSIKNRLNAGGGATVHTIFYDGKKETLTKIAIDFWAVNHFSKNDLLKIDSAVIEIYRGNSLFRTINILDYLNYTNESTESYGGEIILDVSWTKEDMEGLECITKIVDKLGLEYIF